MTDSETIDIEKPVSSRSTRITSRLRKLFFTAVILGTLWLVVTKVIAPIVFRNASEIAPSSEFISTQQDTSAIETRLHALEKEVAELRTKIETPKAEATTPPNTANAIEEPPSAPPPPAPLSGQAEFPPPPPALPTFDTSALETRIATLEAELAKQFGNVEATHAVGSELAEQKTTISELRAEMEALKTEQQNHINAFLLIAELRDAIEKGEAYSATLAALKELRPNMIEMLAPLDADANTGIATFASLKQQFQNAINPALHTSDEKKSFIKNLGSLVRVRKVGESQKGGDDESIIARAEAALAKDDLVTAIAEIGTVSAATAPSFEPWVARAKTKIAADRLIADLQKLVAAPAATKASE